MPIAQKEKTPCCQKQHGGTRNSLALVFRSASSGILSEAAIPSFLKKRLGSVGRREITQTILRALTVTNNGDIENTFIECNCSTAEFFGQKNLTQFAKNWDQ